MHVSHILKPITIFGMSDRRRDAEDSLTKKRQFYEDLEANLESDDDDTPDPGRVSSVEALNRAATRKTESLTSVCRTLSHLLETIQSTTARPNLGPKPFQTSKGVRGT